MSEITLTVRMVAKPGCAAKLESALRDATPPTHAEAGCIRYALHKAADNPDIYLLIERWTSQAALDEHLAQPFIKKLLAEIKELAQSTEVASYTMVAVGSSAKLL
jgi:quinol monooxygenase YgiN